MSAVSPRAGKPATPDMLIDVAELEREYFARRYRPDQLLVAAAGALEHDRVVELVERSFTPPTGAALPLSTTPPAFEPTTRHDVRDDLQQLYLSLGTRGIAWQSPDRYALVVLHTLLGGGMSSRLFQSVREEAGLAYSVYTATDFHRDSGQLSIHLGVSPERGREALARVRTELIALCERGPAPEEVDAARHQIRGSDRRTGGSDTAGFRDRRAQDLRRSRSERSGRAWPSHMVRRLRSAAPFRA